MLRNQAQYREIFVPLLKQIRLHRGLTQVEVANRLKVPQSYVSKYEAAERRLDFVETIEICRALGVSGNEFVRAFEKCVKASQRRKRVAGSGRASE